MPPTESAAGRGGPTRQTPVALLVIAGALLVARIATGVWAEANPASRPDLVTWISPAAAASDARDQGRTILYAFTDRRVAASRDLAADLFSDANAARQIQNRFVPVRIEGPPSADTPVTAGLRRRFEVTELPTLVVATADGSKFRRIAGYEDATTTLHDLQSAMLELMGVPMGHGGRGFQLRLGGPGGGVTAGPDSTDPGDAPR